MKRSYLRTAVKAALLLPAAAGLAAMPALAQQAPADDDVEVIQVRGLLGSMARSLEDKKIADNISDSISAEDLGKFPDQNVAESLQRITGVSIDRSGGEGQFVTVRGFGPEFNTVLVNGRQIATENRGREFSFDTLPAELISGAAVYKSPTADMQEGGIGATVNVTTARPFDLDGFKIAASAKGVYDDLSEDVSPQISGLISNTFNDDKMGILFAVSRQERSAQTNMLESRYWRPGVNITNRSQVDQYDAEGLDDSVPDYQFNNVYVPQNFDQIVDIVDRTRTSANMVFQFAPSDTLTMTFDGLYSKFEVESDAHSLGHWFSDSNLDNLSFNENGSLTSLDSTLVDGVGGATDFIRRNYNRDVEISAFGANFEWVISDQLTANIDLSTSKAEDNSGGKVNFNVVGYNNAYTVNYGGDSATIDILGGEQAVLNSSLGNLHYNERNGWDVEDTISEYRVDFEWTPDSDNAFTKMEFGVYYQDREKDNQRKFASLCGVYCGYQAPYPSNLLTQFTPTSFFSGVPDTWLTYDPEEYFAYAQTSAAIADAQAAYDANPSLDDDGNPIPRDMAAEVAAANIDNPSTQGDAFNVQEEVLSAYTQFFFNFEVADMPLDVNFGFRYSQTDSSVTGIGRVLTDLQPVPNDPSDLNEVYATAGGVPVEESNSYTNVLPNVNVKLELTSDLILRYAYSETLTRPTMADLVPAFNVTSSRPDNNQAQSGNAALKPFLSTNWDLSLEWYYSDFSYFAGAVFQKEVDDFIVASIETETLSLDSGSYDFSVRRPRNGETANVDGLELAWTHVFENGFGFQVNATMVDSDAVLDLADTSQIFALEGLGDSQNLVLFYEKDAWQARVAFNNREGFMQDLVSPLGGTEPRFTETYGQWDVSASYEVNENWTVFFEGINVTGEELRRHGRFTEQFVQLIDDGARYTFGVRANF